MFKVVQTKAELNFHSKDITRHLTKAK